uniref:Uncharacterized protein n=1 Tax=Vannella robusta TaxID=1487602 RepID=A0A7S4IRX7_9EUKA
MSFDQYYFANSDLGNGYSAVKIGDSRSTSTNASNYRGNITKSTLHGNSHMTSPGKMLENSVFGSLVERGMAKQVGNSETYIVKNSTANSISRIVQPSGGVVTHGKLQQMMNSRINYSDNRRVHGNTKADPF